MQKSLAKEGIWDPCAGFLQHCTWEGGATASAWAADGDWCQPRTALCHVRLLQHLCPLNSGGLSALPLAKGSAYSSGPLPGSCLITFFGSELAQSKHHLKYTPQCVLHGWWSWQEVFNWLPLLLLSPFLKIFSNVISSTPVIRTLLSCVSLMPTLLVRHSEENRYFQAQSGLCPAMFIPIIATMNLFLA